jgi:hypothetical protein
MHTIQALNWALAKIRADRGQETVLLADTHLRLYLGHLHAGDMVVDDLDLVPVRQYFLFGASTRNRRICEIS